MFTNDNFTQAHLLRIREQTKADPAIIERMIYAFGLLEAISKVGLSFIFKGGTSLMVLLNKPRRLSTDIDIVVEPGTDIDEYIKKAGILFPFKWVKENLRGSKTSIDKRHFYFYFDSPRIGEEIRVLLDVVFEDNPYLKVIEKEIKNNLLLSKGENLMVRIPDKNCVLGDKLTAFAPHTTGIPFGINKELEIIKQMYDCWTILQEMDDYKMVSQVYERVSRIEMGYRNLELTSEDCLYDTIQSCICILGKGSIREDEYKHYQAGIVALKTHIFSGTMNGEIAAKCASEIMYLATCIMTKNEYERIENPDAYRTVKLPIQGVKKVNSLRNIDPEAYAYMVRAFQMLLDYGLYKNGVMGDGD